MIKFLCLFASFRECLRLLAKRARFGELSTCFSFFSCRSGVSLAVFDEIISHIVRMIFEPCFAVFLPECFRALLGARLFVSVVNCENLSAVLTFSFKRHDPLLKTAIFHRLRECLSCRLFNYHVRLSSVPYLWICEKI